MLVKIPGNMEFGLQEERELGFKENHLRSYQVCLRVKSVTGQRREGGHGEYMFLHRV